MAKLGTTAFRPGVPTRPDYIKNIVLTASTAKQVDVPSGMGTAYISSEVTLFLTWGTNPTSVVPSVDVTDGTGVFLMARDMWLPCSDIAKISMIARVAGAVSVAFYT